MTDQLHELPHNFERLGLCRISEASDEECAHDEAAGQEVVFRIDQQAGLRSVSIVAGGQRDTTKPTPVIILFDPPDTRRYRYLMASPARQAGQSGLRKEMSTLDGYAYNAARSGIDPGDEVAAALELVSDMLVVSAGFP